MESGVVRHRHRPRLWPALLALGLLTVLLLGGAVLVAAWKNIPLSSLTRDPVLTEGLRWQTGLLYKIGVLVWGAITATCLLGAAMWRRDGNAHRFAAFLLASAILTLFFALDDVFQFRGELYPDHLGLPEVAVLAVYVVVLAVFVIVFRAILLRTDYVLLAAALVLAVLWLGLRYVAVEEAVQDAVKLVGQLTLLLYFFRVSAYGLQPRSEDA